MVRLLTGRSQPSSGFQLSEMMREEGDIVPLSQIYRTLRQLVDSDAVRKINLSSGYVIKTDTGSLDLCCSHCGRLTTIPAGETLDALQDLAATSGFKASRYVVEVCGICRDCKQHS